MVWKFVIISLKTDSEKNLILHFSKKQFVCRLYLPNLNFNEAQLYCATNASIN